MMSAGCLHPPKIGRKPRLPCYMKSPINASFHCKKNSLINAALRCFHPLPPRHAPFHFWDLPPPQMAELSSICEVEMSAQDRSEGRLSVSSKSRCPPKPPPCLSPPSQKLERGQSLGESGGREKRERGRAAVRQRLCGAAGIPGM